MPRGIGKKCQGTHGQGHANIMNVQKYSILDKLKGRGKKD